MADDAGIEKLNEENKHKAGVSVGSGIGGLETIYNGSLTINTERKNYLFFYPIVFRFTIWPNIN